MRAKALIVSKLASLSAACAVCVCATLSEILSFLPSSNLGSDAALAIMLLVERHLSTV